MPRRRTNRKQARKQRATRGTRSALVMGGPNATVTPSITLKQTGTFDLTDASARLAIPDSILPQKLSIYAIPPRDTSITTGSPSNQLASITCQLFGRQATLDSSIQVQENVTVLPFNGGPKLVARIDFTKLVLAGLDIDMRTIGASNYYTPVWLDVTTDLAGAWAGDPISLYVVLEGIIRYQPVPYMSWASATSPTGVTDLRIIDNDMRKSKAISNNSVAAFRLAARSNAVVQFQRKSIASGSEGLVIAGAAQAQKAHD